MSSVNGCYTNDYSLRGVFSPKGKGANISKERLSLDTSKSKGSDESNSIAFLNKSEPADTRRLQ